jgi:hypothetical protein
MLDCQSKGKGYAYLPFALLSYTRSPFATASNWYGGRADER